MAFLDEATVRAMGFAELGRNVRISAHARLYRTQAMRLGDEVRVDDFCLLAGNITLGRHVHLAAYSNVQGNRAGVVMEDFSGLAFGCHLIASSDDYGGSTLTNPTVPDHLRQITDAPVHLGRHVILGAGTVVLPGVTIGEGAAVGAMSLVTRDLEPWCIHGGVPARKLRERSRELLALEARLDAEEGR